MSAELQPGMIQFYDSYTPSLEDGDYVVDIKHTLGVTTDVFTATQSFTVRGPQLTLPADDVCSVFPPAGSSGTYGLDLPHVVLSKKVLPWERQLENVKGNGVPWLALLCFREDELLLSDDRDTRGFTVTAGSLQTADGDIKPALTIESDIDLSSMCQVIKVSGDVLQQVLPLLTEIKYLAHTRQVDPDGSEDLGLKDPGWFSVVMSNRFPVLDGSTEGVKNIVHLVSLEGFENIVNDPTLIQQDGTYQLVSLYAWSFTCISSAGATFSDLVANFVSFENGQATNLLLKLPVPAIGTSDAETEMANRLNTGYVPLAYNTMAGESSFAWYRGPLLPGKTTIYQKDSSWLSASSTTIFDPVYGIFDQSWAVAWQTGRAMALADRVYCQRLFAFRNKGNQTTDVLLERLASPVLSDREYTPASLVKGKPVKELFIRSLTENPKQGPGFVSGAGKSGSADSSNVHSAAFRKTVHAGMSPAAVKAFMQKADVVAVLQDVLQDDLTALGKWLADLHLLRNIPFSNLVSDTRLLPVESLRFFYVDTNWLEVLIDGALSVGAHSTRDTEFQEVMSGAIRAAVNNELTQRRSAITGLDIVSTDGSDAFDQPMTGVLIRSALISGWPGLVIKASQSGNQLKNLRVESLSPSVLIGIFLGIPDQVEISEPQHSLRFGLDDKGNTELRNLGTTQTGGETGNLLSVLDYMRSGAGNRVINIMGLAGQMATELKIDPALFGAADFAIQMIQAPEKITFKL